MYVLTNKYQYCLAQVWVHSKSLFRSIQREQLKLNTVGSPRNAGCSSARCWTVELVSELLLSCV